MLRLCLIGDSSSIHVVRWAQHFSKGADVLVVSTRDAPIPGVRVEPLFASGSKLRKLLRIPRLRRLVKEFDADIVHGHYLTVGGLYAVLSGGKRIVGSAWGSDIYDDPVKSLGSRILLRFVMRRCSLIFAGSRDAEETVRKYSYDGKVAIVRFGVDANAFKPSGEKTADEFSILHLRHCSRIYNPLVILEGFRLALPDIGNAYLYMLESGNQIGQIHSIVESDANLRRHVRFIEWSSFDDVPGRYRSVDVAISVPDSDSVAASVMESMASELVVITSDIPNMRELIEDGKTGYLISINASDLADRLRMAYSDRARSRRIGQLARQRILDPKLNATWESNMRAAEDAYVQVMATKPRR